MNKKIYIKTFGCTLNQKDSERICKGRNITKNINNADIIIVNTCGVKEQTETKIKKYLRYLKKEKIPNSKLIITGCLVTINKGCLKNICPNAKYFEVKEQNSLLDFLDKQTKIKKNIKKKYTEPIIISNGCLGECTYCAVKFARGKLKSKKPKKIIKEIKEKYEKGSREFLITAQDTGCYGFDINTNIIELLEKIIDIKGDFKIRLGMSNPLYLNKFKEDIVRLFQSNKIYKFLHMPIQSASNKILKKMKRPYKIEMCKDLIKYFKDNIKNITLATDIIVGFPEETKEDFQKSIDLIRKYEFNIIFISRYGQRKNIEANKFEDMHSKFKKKRSRKLTKVCNKINLKNNKKHIGKIKEIIINEKGKNNSSVGRTKEYKPVVIKKRIDIGEKLKVKIINCTKHYLIGKMKKS